MANCKEGENRGSVLGGLLFHQDETALIMRYRRENPNKSLLTEVHRSYIMLPDTIEFISHSAALVGCILPHWQVSRIAWTETTRLMQFDERHRRCLVHLVAGCCRTLWMASQKTGRRNTSCHRYNES